MDDNKSKTATFLNRDMLDFKHGSAWSLVLDLFSESSGNIVIRGMTKEGRFEFIQPVGSGSLQQQFVYGISDIPIFVTVTASHIDIGVNASHIQLTLGLNGTRLFVLCSGYPRQSKNLTWPSIQSVDTLSDRGQLVALTGTNPGAGVQISVTVPPKNWWLIKSLFATLVTNATGGNRRPTLQITVNGIIVLLCSAGTVTTANSTVRYSWADGLGLLTDGQNLISNTPLPRELLLPPGSIIDIIDAEFSAGDNWSAPNLYVQRYLSD